MAVLEVSSREFRDKQKTIFDLADKGEKIIIRRGKKHSYILTPMDDESLLLSSSMQEKIEKSLQNIRDGKTKRYSLEQLRQKMGL